MQSQKLFKIILFVAISLTIVVPANAQISGKWKTIDDESGEAKSIVHIWKSKDGLYYGKIVKLFEKNQQNSVCDECEPSDPRYKQKVLGMTIISKMAKTGANEWTEGTILDPKNGKVYKCKLFREGKNLRVRGYIAFLYRTQTWLPVE